MKKNDVIKELFEFVLTDDLTKEDFGEYLSTMGANNPTPQQMEKLLIYLPIFLQSIPNK